MSKTPSLIWAQRVEKVFITWECLNTKDINVTLSEGLLSIEGTDGSGTMYKLENVPLFLEIEPEGSKWFKNDRSVVISLKKKTAEWWDTLTKEWKTYKKFCKTDFSKWCEEDDKEYTGELPGVDGMDGMDFGGMGGMGGGMGGFGGDMGSFGDSDDEDDEDDEGADLSDLQPSDLPPLESADGGFDAPPPLEGGHGPPPLEPDVSKMKEVD